MEIYARSRFGEKVYSAKAEFADGKVIIKKGSIINRSLSPHYIKTRKRMSALNQDDTNFIKGNVLNKDITFSSLSTAANFVTGHVSNGMIIWKTSDGKSIKDSIENRR